MTKYFPILTEANLNALIETYNRIDKNPKKLIGTQTFSILIITDSIEDSALNILSEFPFKTSGNHLTSRGGKGIAIIVDYQSKLIQGIKPGLSIPFKRLFKNLIKCIEETYKIYELRKSPRPDVTFKKMKIELKKWGFGLIGFGAIHFVFASVLVPFWGALLIVVGIGNLLIHHRSLFLVNGIVIMIAGLANMSAMGGGAVESGAFGMLLAFQFIWGILEISRFKLYDEVNWSHSKTKFDSNI